MLHTIKILSQFVQGLPILKDRLAVFTNYPSVAEYLALQETVLALFHPVVHGCFQLIGIKIQSPIMIGYRQKLTLKSRTGMFGAH